MAINDKVLPFLPIQAPLKNENNFFNKVQIKNLTKQKKTEWQV